MLARFARFRYAGYNMDAPLGFSADGSALLFAERRHDPETGLVHRLEEVDLATGERRSTLHKERDGVLDELAKRMESASPGPLYHHAARLPDGRIIQGSANRFSKYGVRVRALGEAAELIPDIRIGETNAGVAVNPDGSTVTTGEYHRIQIRDARTLEVLHQILDGRADGNANKTWGITYSPDGSLLAIGTDDGRVMLYDAEFFQKICDLRMPLTQPDATRNYVFGLLWTPDGSRLITTTGRYIHILESQRPIQREHIAAQWNSMLDAARAALDAGESSTALDPAAVRVVRIERWAQKTTAAPQ